MAILEQGVRKWQRSINLVAPSTLPHLRERHIDDSLYLAELVPAQATVADLGSGGGFPGLVIAAHGQSRGVTTHLVESVGKKCAFLREMVRTMELERTHVHHGRIEDTAPRLGVVSVVTARALAPLSNLFALSEPLLGPETLCLFAKGRAVETELQTARTNWQWTELDTYPNPHGDGSVLRFRGISRR